MRERSRRPARHRCAPWVILALCGAPGAAAADATPAVADATAADDSGTLLITPSAGFGWLVEDASADPAGQTVGAGLAVGWRLDAMTLRAAGGWQRHDRTYLAQGAAFDGGVPAVRVEEHSAHGELAVHVDLAPIAGVAWREARFGLYGGLLGRQLINDVYPSLLAGVLVGAEGGLALGPGLRFEAGVDYTHHIGRFFLDDALGQTDSRHGAQFGWMRWRAAFALAGDDLAALSLGYRGAWLALEHTHTFDHAAEVALTLALPL